MAKGKKVVDTQPEDLVDPIDTPLSEPESEAPELPELPELPKRKLTKKQENIITGRRKGGATKSAQYKVKTTKSNLFDKYLSGDLSHEEVVRHGFQFKVKEPAPVQIIYKEREPEKPKYSPADFFKNIR